MNQYWSRETLLTGTHYEGWILAVALGKPLASKYDTLVVKYWSPVLSTGWCWQRHKLVVGRTTRGPAGWALRRLVVTPVAL